MLLGSEAFAQEALGPAQIIENPLSHYPYTDWEHVYRNQYRYDSTFTYVCCPNDANACRVKAYVRNGVAVRLEPTYDHQVCADLAGHTATAQWNPRTCLKGMAFHRRVYGRFRLSRPIIRKGWMEWADAGFPDLTPELKTRFRFDARGRDETVAVSWDVAFGYAARGIIAIATRYSGPAGRDRLLADGYPEEMLTHWKEAGTRTFKLRGGAGVGGFLGRYGMNRFANGLALLDAHVRNVGSDAAWGARTWSNYTWHGDQAPGFPFVHGLQSSDVDFSDVRSSRLIVLAGNNFLEDKIPEAHWFTEIRERGGKVVVIAPEYGPSATRADYWISLRPGLTETALFLGIARIIIDRRWYDADFLKKYTDLPLLIRTDTLKRLRPQDIIPHYQNKDISRGPSCVLQGLTRDQRQKLGDFVFWDTRSRRPHAITRDDVGERLRGLDPALEGSFQLKTVDGGQITVMPLFEAYRRHLKDYGLATVSEITGAPRELIARLAKDIATIKPVSIHIGEAVNHSFHATLATRAAHLPLMLTGNIGQRGAGCHTWGGTHKSAVFQGTRWSGPGIDGWTAEDPFHPSLEAEADGKSIRMNKRTYDEEVAYWGHGDKPLIVNTPKFGRKIFTGQTHMPTPTKLIWCSHADLVNEAQWSYELLRSALPRVELIMLSGIEMTASVEYADIVFPANTWMELEYPDITISGSNPFVQIWKGGIKPLHDTKDDVAILAGLAAKIGETVQEPRFADYWRFALEGYPEIYIQRLLDSSSTTRGYRVDGILARGGAALLQNRTYPRVAFWEQVHESQPFFTSTGRLQAYCDEAQAVAYGENFIVHREGPEATPYLPNVIVSTNPLVRPENFGVRADEQAPDLRAIRNTKKSWARVKATRNPLWTRGYNFLCLTPRSRYRVDAEWSTCDWIALLDSNFGEPFRTDRGAVYFGEPQVHMSPQSARELGILDGDYVFVDANPDDRPYIGWKEEDPLYKVGRLMLRLKYNPACPARAVILYHASQMATEKSVRAMETHADGRALAEDGYQAGFRHGSQSSVTRSWLMPMHQLDGLFHKRKNQAAFVFGHEGENHGVNSVPRETLVRVSRAQPGGTNGGVWEPATSGFTPGSENETMKRYLAGDFVQVVRA